MYEWDDGKEAINREKHGIGFAAAMDFDWASAVLEVDGRYAYTEERVRAFGMLGSRPYCLVFTPRGPNIRIISLRPMHAKEARRYGIQIE
jgi:uncharacterized DUF497 family protein